MGKRSSSMRRRSAAARAACSSSVSSIEGMGSAFPLHRSDARIGGEGGAAEFEPCFWEFSEGASAALADADAPCFAIFCEASAKAPRTRTATQTPESRAEAERKIPRRLCAPRRRGPGTGRIPPGGARRAGWRATGWRAIQRRRGADRRRFRPRPCAARPPHIRRQG